MEPKELVDALGNAFVNGAAMQLRPLMADDCKYESSYTHDISDYADETLRLISERRSTLAPWCSYTHFVAALKDADLRGLPYTGVEDKPLGYALVLYSYDKECPEEAFLIYVNPEGKVARIFGTRDPSVFHADYFGASCGPDSPDDTPATVKTLTNEDRHVQDLRDAFSGQHLDHEPKKPEGNAYIWIKADEFFRSVLKDRGYVVIESQTREDCVAYRCNRDGYAYTVYMYAYGQRKTTILDGEYCAKHLQDPFAANSFVLVSYIHVQKYRCGDGFHYHESSYAGEKCYVEFWRVTKLIDRIILTFFPGLEMLFIEDKLLYAFNHEDADVLESLFSNRNIPIHGIYRPFNEDKNSARCLIRLHKEFGDLQMGFLRFGDVIYSKCPIAVDRGYFSFRCDNQTDKIIEISYTPFGSKEGQTVDDRILLANYQVEDPKAEIPNLRAVQTMAPEETEEVILSITQNAMVFSVGDNSTGFHTGDAFTILSCWISRRLMRSRICSTSHLEQCLGS